MCFVFFQNCVFLSKFKWASVCFDWSSLFFDQSKLFLKISMSLYLFRSIELNISINRKSYGKFFKNWFSVETHFFKKFFTFSLSIRLGQGSISNFCHFRPFFLQGFPLPRLVRPLYHSLCFYFHVFMHKLMHFVGIFGPFQIWDFCWIKLLFLKFIIRFYSYIVIIMLYDG